MVGERDTTFARRLLLALAVGGVTVAQFVPSVIRWITEELQRNPAAADGLRLTRLLSIGEKLPRGVAGDCLRLLPDVELINSYGPTECSDGVAHHRVTAADLDRAHLPIGTPLINCTLYVLAETDGRWCAVQPGEAGELFLGGACVGGYQHGDSVIRPAFFADVVDPSSASRRLFRTRDLVRLAPDGAIEYLQRADRQVKISGVRIELGEVEAVLQRHPGVLSCAVTVAERAGTGPVESRELAAYFVAGPDVTVADLERHVREVLPAAMVPRRWIPISRLPLTQHGKVDYRSLTENARA
jgi:D-alanine--poly(phosphoribitol) ligase subunit 1